MCVCNFYFEVLEVVGSLLAPPQEVAHCSRPQATQQKSYQDG